MSAMQVSGGGVTAISFVYGRDANGRITSISDLAVAGQYRSFAYDGLGRLTSATGPWGSGSYTYDALNNLLTRTLGSRVVEMEYNASNRLHRHRDTGDGNVWRNYAYDSRGNVTNNGSIGFSYDRAERPVSISGGASGSFVYDAHGRRVKQVTGGQTIYSVYSASGTLLYRDNATTSTATDYIRMGGRAIARVRGSDVEWTYADHLGSPAAAASQTGAILWREDHTPFGEARQAPAGNADNEGFTGHIADAASGLVYMQARYYDPVVGRFLSNDPVGFATGGPAYFNRYAYTANDPVNRMDSDGRAWARVAVRAARGAYYGGVSGAVAAQISGDGSTRSTVAGTISGAVAGAIAAQAGDSSALPAVAGSIGGQMGVQMLENVDGGRPIASNLQLDGLAAAGAGVGSQVLAPVSGFLSEHVGILVGGRKEPDGTMNRGYARLNRGPGRLLGAIADGFGTGTGERLGAALTDLLEEAGVPATIKLTDPDGNFDPGFINTREGK